MTKAMKTQDKRAEIEFFARTINEGRCYDHLDPKRRERELGLLGILQAQNQLILDAGCGIGTYGLVLARKGNNVVGIDISADMVKVTKHWADKESLAYLPLAGNIERLPFKNNSFDICFCGYILHHIPNMERAVAELFRVLRPGGIISLIEPNGSNPLTKLGCAVRVLFLSRLCERVGLASKNERTYSYKHYLEVLRKGGFGDIRFSSHTVARVDPKSQRRYMGNFAERLLYFLCACREFAYLPLGKLLPQPYKWRTLYISAVKPEDSIEV